MTADRLAQLPGMLDTPRLADVLVAAQHHERLEARLLRAIGVGDAISHLVLAGQERHDLRSRHVAPEIDHQVAEVVLFLRSDGTVGEEYERPVSRESAHRVIRVDPRVHAGGSFELGPWRPQLGGDDRRAGQESFE